MKQITIFFFIACSYVMIKAQPVDQSSLIWFQNAKCGLFLHWGLYSQTAGEWNGHPTSNGEHFMLYERIPLKEYAKIGQAFNPVHFRAIDWVRKAKRAGLKYLIVTAKHHDGFAMYKSSCSNYNIVKCTPFGRDPMKELIVACRKEGLKFGFYYSLGRDWEDPDVPTNWPVKAGRSNTWDYPNEDIKQLSRYIARKVLPQLTELLTNYGKIDFIWFDTPELVTKIQSENILSLIRKLQPQCLVNKRIGNGLGDYSIIEQKLTNKINNKPWEACITMGKNWCYNRYDTVYKEPDIMLRHLTDIVSKGGNLLLNIGPDNMGDFPRRSEVILNVFHQWLGRYGEAIYGTRPWRTYGENLCDMVEKAIDNKPFHDAVYDNTPHSRTPDIRYTMKGNYIYIIVRNVTPRKFLLKSFVNSDRIQKISLIGSHEKIRWKLSDNGLQIDLLHVSEQFPIYVLKVSII